MQFRVQNDVPLKCNAELDDWMGNWCQSYMFDARFSSCFGHINDECVEASNVWINWNKGIANILEIYDTAARQHLQPEGKFSRNNAYKRVRQWKRSGNKINYPFDRIICSDCCVFSICNNIHFPLIANRNKQMYNCFLYEYPAHTTIFLHIIHITKPRMWNIRLVRVIKNWIYCI